MIKTFTDKQIYMRAYNRRPYVVARRKKYLNRPDIKEKMRIKTRTPEYREKQRQYKAKLRTNPEYRKQCSDDRNHKEKERLRKWRALSDEEQIELMLQATNDILKGNVN